MKEEFNDPDNQYRFFKGKLPAIIYLLPTQFDYKRENGIFDKESAEKREHVIRMLKENRDIETYELKDIPLFGDGLHFSEEGHQMVANIVFDILTK